MFLHDVYNERLVTFYGNEVHSGLPKYRLVRSENQTEKRYGSYDVLTQETGIWLGSKNGLVEVKKYWYLPDCWLVERLEISPNPYLYEKFSYEPILPFLDKDNHPLPLNWKAIEFFLNRLEKATRNILTEADHLAQEEKKQEAESNKVFAELDKPDPVKELPTFKSSVILR